MVATPGRLADHILSDGDGIAKVLMTIKFLVLDEADRMLDGQYALQVYYCFVLDCKRQVRFFQLQTIFKALPKERQTLLFSATITSALSQLHQVIL